jgi:hypothetical protein
MLVLKKLFTFFEACCSIVLLIVNVWNPKDAVGLCLGFVPRSGRNFKLSGRKWKIALGDWWWCLWKLNKWKEHIFRLPLIIKGTTENVVVKNPFHGIHLFQILVRWIKISGQTLLLVFISFYSPHGSSGNVPECSFGRILWNLPWHTLVSRFILLANLQNKFEWRKDDISNFMSSHKLVPLTLALMCICLLGKNPTFLQCRNSNTNSDNFQQKKYIIEQKYVLQKFALFTLP